MPIDRIEPPAVAGERTMLAAWLDYHRATLAIKCDGLDAPALRRRAVPPSTLSLLGLVRHMAEVERGWFRRTLAGEDAPPLYYSEADPDGDFDDVDSADASEAFAAWRGECEHARTLAAAVPSLDEVGAQQRHGETVSLRWILVHMIEEYARHNGHADLLRQCIDGAVGD
ncbi:MAG TPA: DinB family protein [Candidatus Dormibacteraeota bacterium]